MDHRPLHLHSMLVHAPVALAPLAAAALLLDRASLAVGPIEPTAWDFVLRASLLGIFVLTIPSTLTGISERNRMYANWPPSHRAKLALSILLLLLSGFELAALAGAGSATQLGTPFAVAVVVGNCALVIGLAHLGLRITLGRHAPGRTSYVPDMDADPPVDILQVVAAHAAEPAKVIDVREESA